MKKFNSAVICLSHKLNRNNDLSVDSVKRLNKSYELFKDHSCKYFITTGWKYKKSIKNPLSTIMSDYAIKNFKIQKEFIYEEPLAKDTVGEAYFIKKNFLSQNNDINQLIIVTSDWHLARVKEIFYFVFGETTDPKLNFYEIKGEAVYQEKEALNTSILAFRKMIKSCKTGSLNEIYSKMLKNHDLYNE